MKVEIYSSQQIFWSCSCHQWDTTHLPTSFHTGGRCKSWNVEAFHCQMKTSSKTGERQWDEVNTSLGWLLGGKQRGSSNVFSRRTICRAQSQSSPTAARRSWTSRSASLPGGAARRSAAKSTRAWHPFARSCSRSRWTAVSDSSPIYSSQCMRSTFLTGRHTLSTLASASCPKTAGFSLQIRPYERAIRGSSGWLLPACAVCHFCRSRLGCRQRNALWMPLRCADWCCCAESWTGRRSRTSPTV